MRDMLHPGIYKEEILGQPPMEPLSTSIAGFVGVAPKGEIGVPTLITNFEKFKKEFGGYDQNSILAYVVKGFFENGGSRCYVVRTVHYEHDHKTSAPASKDVTIEVGKVFAVSAKNDGVWGNKIEFELKVDKPAGLDHGEAPKTFTLNVYYDGTLKETYKGLTLESVEDETQESSYIKVKAEVLEHPEKATLKDIEKTKLVGGKDGIEGIVDADFLGSGNVVCGLATLKKYPVNFVAIPGETSEAIYSGLLTYADNMKNCVAILDSPAEKK